MPFATLDAPAVARGLAQVSERPGDLVDAYFERLELLELPPDGEPLGARRWVEEGLAVRLLRGGRAWIASRDLLHRDALADALRQVARVHPRTELPLPEIAVRPLPSPEWRELAGFPARVERAVRARRLAFPLRLTVRRHRRDLRVVGAQVAAAPESELFFSCRAELPWGRLGALIPALGEEAAQELAGRLAASFRAREAARPSPFTGPVLLGPAAAAVFLHEAVAHALEADTLAQTGRPEAALGLILGPPELEVLDDPGAAPAGLSRRCDDEGQPVTRRWLLRKGAVTQLLADSRWCALAPGLEPGAARRSSRHVPPAPRSTFLHLLAGEVSLEALCSLAGEGLFFPEAERGSLDSDSGAFTLRFPHGRRIRGGSLAEPVGAGALRGRVADLLSRAVIGCDSTLAGAGWCAKGGQRLPVWALAPPMLLAGGDVTP